MFKFEDDGSKLIFTLMIAISVIIISTILGCTIIDSINIKRYVENGYHRQTVQGSSCVHWVK